jgi:hypothetical protein
MCTNTEVVTKCLILLSYFDRLCVPVVKRVRFPVLPEFVRSSGSGTGFTQPREDN